MSDSLCPQGLYGPRNSPGQNTGMGSLSLLQRIFPTQGSNPGLLYCRRIVYQLSHKGQMGSISFLENSLLVYRNTTDFCTLILYSATSLNLLINSNSFLDWVFKIFFIQNAKHTKVLNDQIKTLTSWGWR